MYGNIAASCANDCVSEIIRLLFQKTDCPQEM